MAPNLHTVARVRDFLAAARRDDPSVSTATLNERLAKEQDILLPLDEVQTIEVEHGLDQRFEHDGRLIGPSGPLSLDDFLVFSTEPKGARMAWICSFCSRVAGPPDAFVLCACCKATTARSDVWCGGGATCMASDRRHKALCGSLVGVLPAPDPSRHSAAARWQVRGRALGSS